MASFKPEEIRALESGGNGVSAHARLLLCLPKKDKFHHVCELFKLHASHKPSQKPASQVALAIYLAKWNPRDAPKPIDR